MCLLIIWSVDTRCIVNTHHRLFPTAACVRVDPAELTRGAINPCRWDGTFELNSIVLAPSDGKATFPKKLSSYQLQHTPPTSIL